VRIIQHLLMSLVAALLPNPARLHRLRSASAARHEIVACDDWQSLTRLCESAAVQAVIVDFCSTGQASFDELRLLKARFPRLALLGYVSMPPARASDLFDAGRFGLAGLIVADENDTPAALLAVLEQAESRGVAVLLARAVQGAPPRVRDALLLTVTRAALRLTPSRRRARAPTPLPTRSIFLRAARSAIRVSVIFTLHRARSVRAVARTTSSARCSASATSVAPRRIRCHSPVHARGRR